LRRVRRGAQVAKAFFRPKLAATFEPALLSASKKIFSSEAIKRNSPDLEVRNDFLGAVRVFEQIAHNQNSSISAKTKRRDSKHPVV
jgi:hypothetical protein